LKYLGTGAVLTAGVLGGGLFSFLRGRGAQSQSFMRARVVAQGLTVLAALGGMLMAARNSPQKK
jgi:hypothetical protein